MPKTLGFKSKAHREKFVELLKEGKITPEQFKEMEANTGAQELLPERLHPSAPPRYPDPLKRARKGHH